MNAKTEAWFAYVEGRKTRFEHATDALYHAAQRDFESGWDAGYKEAQRIARAFPGVRTLGPVEVRRAER